MGYQRAKNFLGPFACMHNVAHVLRNSNQVLHSNQTILDENFYFYRVDHATCRPKNFVTGMLTHDQFAVANLLVRVAACCSPNLRLSLCLWSCFLQLIRWNYLTVCACYHIVFVFTSAKQVCYAALLPRRGPHIASHSVCLSVCPSVPFAEVVL